MKKQPGIFFFKLLLISGPAIIIIISYFVFDPFKVIYTYDSYYQTGQPEYVTLNRDYVSLETFNKYYPKYHYDSYIFGSSRSRYYNADTWGSFIHSNNYFHFDAHGENLYGITRKIVFLAEHKYPLKNALLVVDNECLKTTTDINRHFSMKHYLLSGQSWLKFQLIFFETYCTIDFLRAYLDFRLSGKIKPYMEKKAILSKTPISYKLQSNQISLDYSEQMIKSNPEQYYKEHSYKFERIDSISEMAESSIGIKQKEMLQEIKKIFTENHTQYRIVLNPIYNQEKFNSLDRTYLCELFGKENVFDFSGRNWMTRDKINFYDYRHYRSFISDSIMRIVYQTSSNDTLGPIR